MEVLINLTALAGIVTLAYVLYDVFTHGTKKA